MGLGHMRAAYALRDLANGEIIVDGSETFCRPMNTISGKG